MLLSILNPYNTTTILCCIIVPHPHPPLLGRMHGMSCRSIYVTLHYHWLSSMQTWRPIYFPTRAGPRRICDIYDFFAPHINVLTYLLITVSFTGFILYYWITTVQLLEFFKFVFISVFYPMHALHIHMLCAKLILLTYSELSIYKFYSCKISFKRHMKQQHHSQQDFSVGNILLSHINMALNWDCHDSVLFKFD